MRYMSFTASYLRKLESSRNCALSNFCFICLSVLNNYSTAEYTAIALEVGELKELRRYMAGLFDICQQKTLRNSKT